MRVIPFRGRATRLYGNIHHNDLIIPSSIPIHLQIPVVLRVRVLIQCTFHFQTIVSMVEEYYPRHHT